MFRTALRFIFYDKAKSIGVVVGIVISIFLIGQQVGTLTFLMRLMGGLVDNSNKELGHIWVVDNITNNANELTKLAWTPRSSSLYGLSLRMASTKSFHSLSYGLPWSGATWDSQILLARSGF